LISIFFCTRDEKKIRRRRRISEKQIDLSEKKNTSRDNKEFTQKKRKEKNSNMILMI